MMNSIQAISFFLLLTFLSLLNLPLVHSWVSSSISFPKNNGHYLPLGQHQRSNFVRGFPKSPITTLFVSEDFNSENEINIDDILLEAETALQAAETSLSSPIQQESSPVYQSAVDAIASATGGVLLGGLLGYLLFISIPDLDMLVYSLVPPILLAFIFGVIGFASGFATTSTGSIIRKVFGDPVKALSSSLGLIAKRQVEKSANEVKSIPGKLASSVAKKVEDTVDEIARVPSQVATAAKERATVVADELSDSFQGFVNLVTSKESLILITLVSGLAAVAYLLSLDPTVFTSIVGGGSM
jgi:hypothetical protein